MLQFILTQFIELPHLHSVGVRSGVLFLRALGEILLIYNTTQYIIRLFAIGTAIQYNERKIEYAELIAFYSAGGYC